MRKLATILLLVSLLAAAILPVSVSMASNTTLAEYIGTVRITNNGTTATNVFTVFNLTTQDLIDGDFVFQNVTNTAMQTNGGADTEYMPAPGATIDWAVYIPQIIQAGTLDYRLYLGGNQGMDAEIRYFPGSGGMTSVDSATLELGNNFTITQQGFVNTTAGSDMNLSLKPGAFKTYVSAAGSVTVAILSSGAPVNENRVPDGAGGYTNIASQFPASTSHWDKVDDPPGVPDDDTTYVYTVSLIQEKDAYELQDPTFGNDAIINSVTVYYRFRGNGGAGETVRAQPFLRLNGVETAGTEQSQASPGWIDKNELLARPGGGLWAYQDIIDLQVAVGLLTTNGAVQCRLTQIYVKINYYPSTIDASETAIGITSSDQNITT